MPRENPYSSHPDDRITHRIPLTTHSDLDDEVRRWLQVAYEMDAG